MYVVEENSLAHYGVKGMKWGVRKSYHTGADRNIDMNKKAYRRATSLDNASKSARNMLNSMENKRRQAQSDAETYERKSAKAASKNKMTKRDKYNIKAINNRNIERETIQQINKYIDKFNKEGLRVTREKAQVLVQKGNPVVNAILFGGLGGAAIGVATGATVKRVEGNVYSVRPKNG